MFCTHLRKRSEWAPLVPKLLTYQAPKWMEKNLETHDIAFPLPRQGDQGNHVRMLLLSASDLRSPGDGLARIEKLYHLDGGHHVGIVFLLHEKDSKNDGIIPYMELQGNLLSSSLEMPVIPLFSASSLHTTLFAYQRQLLQPREAFIIGNSITTILPYCTENPPLAERTLNVLSDIFHNFRDLASAATTIDGQEEIRKWLSDPTPQHAEGVIAFWLHPTRIVAGDVATMLDGLQEQHNYISQSAGNVTGSFLKIWTPSFAHGVPGGSDDHEDVHKSNGTLKHLANHIPAQ